MQEKKRGPRSRTMHLTPGEYSEMTKKASPGSPVLRDLVWAFLVGGGICLLGEGLRQAYLSMGKTLGEECQAENVSILLGPAANIKRSPLCGRNFEYFSEDPYLTGRMAIAEIKGVQSWDVGTSMKHYAANNQEFNRMSCSSNLSERAFREIYLTGFEMAVKEAQPKTLMCSYNKINGTYASDNSFLLD